MKTEDLQNIGLSEDQIKAVFALNGKDIEAQKAKVSAMETERDNYKSQFETVSASLKRFDGINPDDIRAEIERANKALTDAQNDFNARILQRDQRDWLNAQFNEYGVTSPYARRQLAADAMSAESGLAWKDGAFYGFNDFMNAAKANDNTLFKTKEEREAETAAAAKPTETAAESKPHIVHPLGNNESSSGTGNAPRFF